ncbi:MAG: carbon starvation protein A [Acidaminococcaceae bacterium]|nr:carbon starvation protein A [Acidaminococcaceae bacterium]
MFIFGCALATLIIGYFAYGKLVDKIFQPDDRKTPALEYNDGIDYVPLSVWRAFLAQLLNIAGTGPVFGALMGAVFGPIVFLWIVLGSIFGGAVHDYMSGMISARNGGASIAELFGVYFGSGPRLLMRFVSVALLILVGAVFITGPAMLLAVLTPDALSTNFWVVVILIYFTLSTFLPIDTIIGRFYPIFGAVLLIMAGGILFNIMGGNYTLPDFTLANLHPAGLSPWPFLFVTVACGAISGFHSTQSPIIAKCIKSERQGRFIFYGAMIAEGIIALVWAGAGLAFYNSTGDLFSAIKLIGPSGVVKDISMGMMGNFGGLLAIIGVIICPITSGDTAFRAARLILAEILNFDQRSLTKRLVITLPLLAVGGVLTQIDFSILWRYFAWVNQTLATLALWMATAYFFKAKRVKVSLLTGLPAIFMTAVTSTYILKAKEGFGLAPSIGDPIGLIFMGIVTLFYVYKFWKAV